jgi:hypothetical protein
MALLDFLARWEPLWLFLILFIEMSIGIRNWFTLEKEYEYDKWFNEQYVIPKKKFKQKKAAFTLPEEKLTTGEMQ